MNTEAELARRALKLYVRNGTIVKPDFCQECMADTPKEKLHGHHDDYSKPFDVIWLCSWCHAKKHRKY